MVELLSLINNNQGLMTLGLLVAVVEMRVHLKHAVDRIRRLEREN